MHLWKAAIGLERRRKRSAENVQHRRVFNVVAGGGSVPRDVLQRYLKLATEILKQSVSKKELAKERSKCNKQVADIQLKMNNQKELFDKLRRTTEQTPEQQNPENKFQLPNIDVYDDEVWATVVSEYTMETVDGKYKIVLHPNDKVIIDGRNINHTDLIRSGYVYIKKQVTLSGYAPYKVFFETASDAGEAAETLMNGEHIRLLLNDTNQVVTQYMYLGQVPIEHLDIGQEEILEVLGVDDE